MATKNGKPLLFPVLQPKVNYHGLPRRYEETKPVITQDFTHRSILSIGNALKRETIEKCEQEKIVAIHEAERAVWEQAEILKKETVEKAVRKVHEEHEKIIKKLTKAHQKAIKEEVLRVEGELQRQALDEVQAEKEAGERKLVEAVAQAVEKGLRELEAAVAEARKEEQAVAQKEKEELIKKYEKELAEVVVSLSEEKAKALLALEKKKDLEREEAVVKVKNEEQAITKQKLHEQKGVYEESIKVIHAHIAEHKAIIANLEEEIKMILAEKRLVAQELLEVRQTFDNFINHVKPFNDTEVSFLIPDLKTITLV